MKRLDKDQYLDLVPLYFGVIAVPTSYDPHLYEVYVCEDVDGGPWEAMGGALFPTKEEKFLLVRSALRAVDPNGKLLNRNSERTILRNQAGQLYLDTAADFYCFDAIAEARSFYV